MFCCCCYHLLITHPPSAGRDQPSALFVCVQYNIVYIECEDNNPNTNTETTSKTTNPGSEVSQNVN